MDTRTLFERLEGRFEGAGNLAIRFPWGRERVRLSDVRLAWYLETYSLLTASHIKVGDFSTPLRCARNDRRAVLCIFSRQNFQGRL